MAGSSSPSAAEGNVAATATAESGKSTHGRDSLPQSCKDSAFSAAEAEQQQREYDGLLVATKSPPRKNCCTWKVAAVFLVFVAGALVLIWQLLPAEEIVVKYLPQFAEPETPYTGPEAGDTASGGAGQDGSGTQGNDDGLTIGAPPSQTPEEDAAAGTTVPSFMQCPEGDELCCNGSPENCKLRVNEMMFGLVHNAMSTEDGGFFIGYNHNLAMEKALIAGYRAINLDVCKCGSVLQFCHNVCDYGERLPNEVFTNINGFLDDYPSEVVVLVFEASLEQGPIVWNDLFAEMGDIDGFVEKIYVHTYGEAWPTMGELVQQKKQVIVFYFNGGTCTDDECPPGFKYFYNYAAETQFESASLEDLQNIGYSCEITRTTQADSRPPDFFVVNNFVTPPDPEAAKTANSKAFLSSRLTDCANENNMRPNFVYLDFWSEGVTAELVQYANQEFAQQLEQ